MPSSHHHSLTLLVGGRAHSQETRFWIPTTRYPVGNLAPLYLSDIRPIPGHCKPRFKHASSPHDVMNAKAQPIYLHCYAELYATYLLRRSLKPSGQSGARRGMVPPITTLTEKQGRKKKGANTRQIKRMGAVLYQCRHAGAKQRTSSTAQEKQSRHARDPVKTVHILLLRFAISNVTNSFSFARTEGAVVSDKQPHKHRVSKTRASTAS